VTDTKKGATIGDLVNQVGQNKIAINFVWTLVAGFLVMFMQAGFAIVETGLCRAKNANHTMMMNFMVYGVGMLAYWLIGFAIQMGGVGAVANLGGTPPLNTEHIITLFGKPFGIFGQNGLFLGAQRNVRRQRHGAFFVQMVFMDTTTTIVTGSCCERWKYAAFIISTFFLGAFTYPLFANWAGAAAGLPTSVPISDWGKGYCDFAGSGVVHSVGGITALAVAMMLGPESASMSVPESPMPSSRMTSSFVLTGCFILAFGWFGFNPGSTLGASGQR